MNTSELIRWYAAYHEATLANCRKREGIAMAEEHVQGKESRALANQFTPAVPQELALMAKSIDDLTPNSIVTTIDMQTQEGRRAVYMAKRGKCEEGKDYVNMVVDLSHFLLHGATTTDDKTGEIVHFTRTVLLTVDGKRIAFGSKGIVESIKELCMYFRRPPWIPPLKVKIVNIGTQGAANFYILDPQE